MVYALVASLLTLRLGVGEVGFWCRGMAVTSFFLWLRIMDEHKDDSYDREVHPERVLQRNIVRLIHLKFLALLALFIMVMVSWLSGKASLLALSAILFWSGLMFKEFFVPSWLKKHLFVYAFVHVMVMPFLVVWCGTLATSSIPWGLYEDFRVLALAILSFLFAMNYEILRKTKGKEELKAGEDSYTHLLTYQQITALVMGISASALLAYGYLMHLSGWMGSLPPWVLWIPVGGSFIFLFLSLCHFNQSPRVKHRKQNEMAGATLTFWCYLTLILAAVN